MVYGSGQGAWPSHSDQSRQFHPDVLALQGDLGLSHFVFLTSSQTSTRRHVPVGKPSCRNRLALDQISAMDIAMTIDEPIYVATGVTFLSGNVIVDDYGFPIPSPSIGASYPTLTGKRTLFGYRIGRGAVAMARRSQ